MNQVASTVPNSAPPTQTGKGHPKGLYVLFATEMWERFNYYGMRAILVLFMTQALLFDKVFASNLYGSYTSLVYLTPLLGGFIADRYWGNKRSIIAGGIVMALGEFVLFFCASLYKSSPDVSSILFFTGLGLMIAGEQAFEVTASVHTILQCERLALNCMQRMSGIATLTKRYSDKLQGYKTRLLDTRKTTPNFRLLEKEAVRIGGGYNHRMGLYDMIMLKDNHIDYSGGLEKAIERAWNYVQQVKPGLKIEVETRTVQDVERVVAIGKVDRIMLDNFTPEQITAALKIIKGRYETEASGGITLDNITSYAETGVDFVSVGALIHQAASLDLSLKAVLL